MNQKGTPEAQLIFFGKLLYQKGLVAGTDGNLSLRTDKDVIFITASGVHKGFLGIEQILKLDASGNLISGLLKPSSESGLHIEIYSKVPECGAIIHAHAPWSTAASLEHDCIDLSHLAEGKLLFGKVEVVPYHPPGTAMLARASSDAATRSKVHILKAHGVVAWGKDLKEAFCLVEALENNIKILGISKMGFQPEK